MSLQRLALMLLLLPVTIPANLTAQQLPQPDVIGLKPLPGLTGATSWLNSPPLTAAELKGHVVLVDFWDYSCINCIRAIPYIRAWADKYKDSGLIVIGVHAPEFDAEKEIPNVERAVKKFQITYPVALDNNLKVWAAFHNLYWPAHYFIDANGKIRFTHFGEGEYEESEQWIQKLLKEASKKQATPMPAMPPVSAASVRGLGVEAAPSAQVGSPETYIGYDRAERYSFHGGIVKNTAHIYESSNHLDLNHWNLTGSWTIHHQSATPDAPGARISFRFHARDLHLVLGPAPNGQPVRFRVTLDGHPPAASHGVDIDSDGSGTVHDDRLYQLIRQSGPITDHTFTIEFLDPGVQAFSFTFG